ncbi:hypothetical protein BDV25DRAFT_135586 [Aspergillus avenaceus]|uniref:Integral membrane protein n=1 Tax=Aspergillus avenaceus TaxID=36643 RepID=A0A5N6U7R1_ASPAV|nr:hypothetical protein BDV25DRAFT_135586 [Aspergillus avenaceus]
MPPKQQLKALAENINSHPLYTKTCNPQTWQYCSILCGPLWGLTFLLGLIAMRSFPPMPPSWDADRVHAHYKAYHTGTEAAAALFIFTGGFFLPWGAVISRQISRIPNVDPILPQLQLASAAAGVFSFIFSGIFLGVITFRDRGPQLTLLLSDLFWISTLIQWPTLWMQSWTFAWAVFADCSARPMFPKLVAWVNVVTPIVFACATGVHTQFHGPYAWNGVFAFWMALGFLGLEIGLDALSMLKNVREEGRVQEVVEVDSV